MKIAFQPFSSSPGDVNIFTGGEGRWNVNTYDMLKRAGHEVHYVRPGQDDGFDLYLDAPWDHCPIIKSRHHIHQYFSPLRPDIQEGLGLRSCVQAGKAVVASPYRTVYEYSHRETANNPLITLGVKKVS